MADDRLWTAAGSAACAVGLTATAAPALVARVFGLPAPDGPAALAWRLFGVRTLVVGAGVVRGSADARAAVVPVQLLDQAVFATSLLTGGVPRTTWVRAAATSAGLIALATAAARSGAP